MYLLITLQHTLFEKDNFHGTWSHSYFLSHFHSDHLSGLGKRFSKGVIYATRTTCNLVARNYGLAETYLHPLAVGTPYFFINCAAHELPAVRQWIQRQFALSFLSAEQVVLTPDASDDPARRVVCAVDVLDANHCPGSCMFLFSLFDWGCISSSVSLHDNLTSLPMVNALTSMTESTSLIAAPTPMTTAKPFSTTLYTGDFRFLPSMLETPALRPFCDEGAAVLDRLEFDNTYSNKTYCHPPQSVVVATAVHILTKYWKQMIEQHSDRIRVYFGSYKIGKENLWLEVAKQFHRRVYVDP